MQLSNDRKTADNPEKKKRFFKLLEEIVKLEYELDEAKQETMSNADSARGMLKEIVEVQKNARKKPKEIVESKHGNAGGTCCVRIREAIELRFEQAAKRKGNDALQEAAERLQDVCRLLSLSNIVHTPATLPPPS